jgi:hypothetical protein
MNSLFLALALAAPASVTDCDLADTHFYATADIEQFPASVSGEIDYAQSKIMQEHGQPYYEVVQIRCSGKIRSLVKIQDGKPQYGFQYIYEGDVITELRMLYVNGHPTSYLRALTI